MMEAVVATVGPAAPKRASRRKRIFGQQISLRLPDEVYSWVWGRAKRELISPTAMARLLIIESWRRDRKGGGL